MAWSRQAGIILPGYNPLLVANAPTIGTATAGSSCCASVTFTAPSCTGGSVITTYTVYANCGTLATTGASSPLVVSGLTQGSSYTFKVIATNIYGPSFPSAASNSITIPVQGSQTYTTAGTYSWVAPAGVTSVSVVAIGGGGAGAVGTSGSASGGGGGGALAYKNNISVTPASSYTVVVGARGAKPSPAFPKNGGDAGNSTVLCVVAGGGKGGLYTCSGKGGAGGTYSGTGVSGGNGGKGGCGLTNGRAAGGGGAGGYAGTGGAGGNYYNNGSAGAGGGGGGGGAGASCNLWAGGGGGGVGLYGQGSNGAGGAKGASAGPTATQGGGGSCGSGGISGCCSPQGGNYGGGSAGLSNNWCAAGGAVRIVWPGNTRSFPSTNVGAP